jgi:hypothetical protein
MIQRAKNEVVVLNPSSEPEGDLETLQVTTKSPMGAITYHSGGILIDHGWVRVLGSRGDRMGRSIIEWNRDCGIGFETQPPMVLVADDVLGGMFALNGGVLPGNLGDVMYFSPSGMTWQTLGRSYTDTLNLFLNGDLDRFYGSMRWPGWQEDVEPLKGDQAIGVYPCLWAKGVPVAERSRFVVPLDEIFRANMDLLAQWAAR